MSPGTAYGILRQITFDGPGEPSGAGGSVAPADEAERFRHGLSTVVRELREHVDDLEAHSFAAEAAILRAHVAMLHDPEFQRRVHELIEKSKHSAEAAVEAALHQLAVMMAAAGDESFSEKTADFRDLTSQLKARLTKDRSDLRKAVGREGETVVAVHELLPSLVLEARELEVKGFVVAQGTTMSHAAILAKSFSLPVVRVADFDGLMEHCGAEVLVDGDAASVTAEPPAQRPAKAPARRRDHAGKHLPARLWVSVADPRQLEGVDWQCVEGVGLYRTEVLFLQQAAELPSEQEQFRTYRQIFSGCGKRPAVVRTADLGADKLMAHMSFGPQQNPYLGLRAHRIFRFHPEILITQVRAILRAAAGGQLRLMFPMLETVDQWSFVRGLVKEAVESLGKGGTRFQHEFQCGVLVETPSAAWSLGEFLEEADFLSVGTNDLVQYFFAAERNSANLGDFYLPAHPAMLRLLGSMAAQAARAGKPLSLCGEIAAEASLVPLLVGLGYADFAVPPGQVHAMHDLLAGLDASQCRALAERCLRCRSHAEVRSCLGLEDAPDAAVGRAMPEGHAVDPVCGMVVHTGTEHHLEHGGSTLWFCSARCLRRFRTRDKEK